MLSLFAVTLLLRSLLLAFVLALVIKYWKTICDFVLGCVLHIADRFTAMLRPDPNFNEVRARLREERKATGDMNGGEEEEMGERMGERMGDLPPITHAPLNSSQLLYIPLRLSAEERAKLLLLESALNVSEYTDKVDIYSYRSSKLGRIKHELEDFFRIVLGLNCSAHYRHGRKMITSRSFEDNAEFLQSVCEIGRRFKIQNPDKMRTTYGKLMWMLQDSVDYEVERAVGFSLKTEIQTVARFLKPRDGSALLSDPALHSATEQIPTGLSREEADERVRQKQEAIAGLIEQYTTQELHQEDIERVISSVADFRCFLFSNQYPVDRMIGFLKQHFDIDLANSCQSLALRRGVGTSCLSHTHSEQFVFVLQSLTLWREIMGEMFKLWIATDIDLLSEENDYRLRDTGQGLNRMQSCPRVANAMRDILSRVQSKVGSWVGLSVVHLGDRDVPNALVFIDKYNQVARILAPIVQVIDQIDKQSHDPHFTAMVNEFFGSSEELKQEILADFFKHGFDGSGDDGGSCIDGRLTSAWNWCSRLEKKRFYHIFLLCGFTGFDGEIAQ